MDEKPCTCDHSDFAWDENGEYRCLHCKGLQGGATYHDADLDDGICQVCDGTGTSRYGGKCRHCHGEGIR